MLVYGLILSVLVLIGVILYLHHNAKKPSKVPGLDPASKEDGNLGDLAKAGSLHEFLLDLHKQLGPIASFWWGSTYTVSIADHELFKEHQSVFDRPPKPFELFEPLIGKKCIQFANGTEGRARRKTYAKSMTANSIHKYFNLFQEMANELAKKWKDFGTEEHIPITQHMAMFALKSVLLPVFGEAITHEKKLTDFKAAYDQVWSEMEHRLTVPVSEYKEKALKDGKEVLHAITKEMVIHRKENPRHNGEEVLLDLIIDYTEDEEIQFCDALVYIIAGFHTMGNVLSWCIYYMATNPEIQEKVYTELKDKLGERDVDHTNIEELRYLRQVIDETLRCAVVAPYAARFQDFDSELGGYKIPKNTPVIHAIGTAGKNEKYFPMPDKFDPDRSSPENAKPIPTLQFSPFGFAGGRKCPAYKFAYAEATVLLATILRKFRVKMVEGQVIKPVHGLVTHPSTEIWVTISNR